MHWVRRARAGLLGAGILFLAVAPAHAKSAHRAAHAAPRGSSKKSAGPSRSAPKARAVPVKASTTSAAGASKVSSTPSTLAPMTEPKLADAFATTQLLAPGETRHSPAQFAWVERHHVDMDARADAKRDEALDKLKKLLVSADNASRPELMFRFAELLWAKAKFLEVKAMTAWDAQLDAWHKRGGKGAEPVLAHLPDAQKSETLARQCVGMYQKIIAGYPGYPRRDEVLYDLAGALVETHDGKGAEVAYERLLKEFPASDFLADAWLQLGERYFNSNRLPEATRAYTNAAATQKPRIYAYALYKLAWCDYNRKAFPAALDKLKKVIAYARDTDAAVATDGAVASRDRIQLREEALSDMVRVYADMNATDAAFGFFGGELAAAKGAQYLARLARIYHGQGKYTEEIAVVGKILDMDPDGPEAPQSQGAIVSAYAELGKPADLRRAVRVLIDTYAPEGPWARHNDGNQALLANAATVVESQLAALVTEQHRTAQTTQLTENYQLARDLYKEYLDKFAHNTRAYTFRFYYAELLFELKDFAAAAEQYVLVGEAKAGGEFAKQAAYGAVVAWDHVVEGVRASLGKKLDAAAPGKTRAKLAAVADVTALVKGDKLAPEPLSDAEEKLVAACDAFVALVPQDAEALKVRFKAARLYYNHREFDDAAERFDAVIAAAPQDNLARLSASAILESFNARENWALLAFWGRRFLGNKKLVADAGLRAKAVDCVEGAAFNTVHFVYEPKGDLVDVAARYEAFVKEFPTSKYAPVALYNAAVNYDKAGLFDKSMAALNTMLAGKNSKDANRGKALLMQAALYERLGQFEHAAESYEGYASEVKTGDGRADALYNAAQLRDSLGQYNQAIASLNMYAHDYPKNKDADEVMWKLGALWESKKDYHAAWAHYSNLAKTYGHKDAARALCSELHAVQALQASGKEKDAVPHYATMVAAYNKLGNSQKTDVCAREAAALASFQALEPQRIAYEALGLAGSDAQMARNVVKKLELAQQLQKRYTDVVAIGNGTYAVASLYRIGSVYQHLAQALQSSRCPAQLSTDECSVYQSALQDKAFPLEEKAVEALHRALSTAYELGMYNTWLTRAQDALKTYEPTKFPEAHAYPLAVGEMTRARLELVGEENL